jgi:hypothetical protein
MSSTVSFHDVSVIKDTGKALLCLIEGEEIWIPQWAVHEDSEVYNEDTEGELVILERFAEKEGLG